MNLNNLSPDIFIKHITYLPFRDVINLCQANPTQHKYCTDPKYSIRWKVLVENTFSDIDNYDSIK